MSLANRILQWLLIVAVVWHTVIVIAVLLQQDWKGAFDSGALIVYALWIFMLRRQRHTLCMALTGDDQSITRVTPWLMGDKVYRGRLMKMPEPETPVKSAEEEHW